MASTLTVGIPGRPSSSAAPLSASPEFLSAKDEVPRVTPNPSDDLRPTGGEHEDKFSELRFRLRGILARQNVSVDPHLAKIMREWEKVASFPRTPTEGGGGSPPNPPQARGTVDTQPQDAKAVEVDPASLSTLPEKTPDVERGKTAEVEIPIEGLLTHPLIAALGVDSEAIIQAAEDLGPKVVRVNRYSGCLCPIMRGERSTLFLRDLPVDEVSVETLTELILKAPMVPDASVISSIRHEPVGNLWFVTLSSSSLATETALWLRQQNYHNREIVVGVKSEAEYVSLLARPPANFNVEGMFVPGKTYRLGGRANYRLPGRTCEGQLGRPGYYSSPRWRGWIQTGPPGTYPPNPSFNGVMRYDYPAAAQDLSRSSMHNPRGGGGQFQRGSPFHQRGRGTGSRRGGTNFNYGTRDGMMVLPHRIQSLKSIQQHATRRKNSPRKGDCVIACDRNHACLPFAPDEIDDVNDFPPITLAAKMASQSPRAEQPPPSL